MHIHGTTHVHGAHGINAPHSLSHSQASSTSAPDRADRVEISPAAEAAIAARETGGIRQDLVNLIRSQIAAGTYDTPEKMDIALERMLDEIA